MPSVHINYLAVLVVAAINMAVGSLWFSPVMFAERWMKAIGKKREDLGQPGPAMVLMAVGALVMAYVLAHIVSYALAVSVLDGARTGLWLWLGFVAPVALGVKLFENRPWEWFSITAGYYLIVLLVGGAILAAWV